MGVSEHSWSYIFIHIVPYKDHKQQKEGLKQTNHTAKWLGTPVHSGVVKAPSGAGWWVPMDDSAADIHPPTLDVTVLPYNNLGGFT